MLISCNLHIRNFWNFLFIFSNQCTTRSYGYMYQNCLKKLLLVLEMAVLGRFWWKYSHGPLGVNSPFEVKQYLVIIAWFINLFKCWLFDWKYFSWYLVMYVCMYCAPYVKQQAYTNLAKVETPITDQVPIPDHIFLKLGNGFFLTCQDWN